MAHCWRNWVREHVKGVGGIAFSCVFLDIPRFRSSDICRSSDEGVFRRERDGYAAWQSEYLLEDVIRIFCFCFAVYNSSTILLISTRNHELSTTPTQASHPSPCTLHWL